MSLSRIFQQAYEVSTTNKLKVTRAEKIYKTRKVYRCMHKQFERRTKNDNDGMSKTRFYGGFLGG